MKLIQKSLLFALALLTINYKINASAPQPPTLTDMSNAPDAHKIVSVGLSPSSFAPSPSEVNLAAATPSTLVFKTDLLEILTQNYSFPKVLAQLIIQYLITSNAFVGASAVQNIIQVTPTRFVACYINGTLKMWHIPTCRVLSNGLSPVSARVRYLTHNKADKTIIASTSEDSHTFSFKETGELGHGKHDAVTATYGALTDGRLIQRKKGARNKPFLTTPGAKNMELKTLTGIEPLFALLPDGTFILGNRMALDIFSPASGQPVKTIAEVSGASFCSVAAAHNGNIWAGVRTFENGQNGFIIRNINSASGETESSFTQPHWPVAVAGLPNDLGASACGKTVKIWHRYQLNRKQPFLTLEDHEANVTTLCTLSDGTLLSGDDTGLIKRWDVPARLALAPTLSQTLLPPPPTTATASTLHSASSHPYGLNDKPQGTAADGTQDDPQE